MRLLLFSLISLTLLGASHMLWVRWAGAECLGSIHPSPGQEEKEFKLFLLCEVFRWLFTVATSYPAIRPNFLAVFVTVKLKTLALGSHRVRRGTKHFRKCFTAMVHSKQLPEPHWHTACPPWAGKHHQLDICCWECPRNHFFRALLLWQRSFIFQEMTQKGPAWIWRLTGRQEAESRLAAWLESSLKIFLLRRCEGQTIKTPPDACQSVSENGVVLDLSVKSLLFVNASFKAVSVALHLQSTATVSLGAPLVESHSNYLNGVPRARVFNLIMTNTARKLSLIAEHEVATVNSHLKTSHRRNNLNSFSYLYQQ